LPKYIPSNRTRATDWNRRHLKETTNCEAETGWKKHQL
jgi:hypothetical protein